MKKPFKYILFFLVTLGLLVIGDNLFTTYSNQKYVNETEWRTKAISSKKGSKCCDFIQCIYDTVKNVNIKTWSYEYTSYYNQKVRIKLISQIKILSKVGQINWVINKLYIPRKSIESKNNSCKKTDLHRNAVYHAKLHDAGINMFNYLLKKQWINQQINFSGISTELNAYQDGLESGHA